MHVYTFAYIVQSSSAPPGAVYSAGGGDLPHFDLCIKYAFSRANPLLERIAEKPALDQTATKVIMYFLARGYRFLFHTRLEKNMTNLIDMLICILRLRGEALPLHVLFLLV